MLKKNPELDTTRFVNVYTSKFVFHINKQPMEVNAGEEKIFPVFVAQIGAKHLVDLILQEKHNIKDTLRDTPLRQSLFAQILPDMAEEAEIKPLSDEEFRKQVEAELKRQKEIEVGRDEEITALKKEVEGLKSKIQQPPKKVGRPPKA